MSGKSKISNTEWGLVIGALFTIDGVQIVLDLFVIGAVINRFIDIFVGLSFALYLQLRGQSLVNPKRLLALLATFTGEMIPVVDALPLWGLDGIVNMSLSKVDTIIKKVPGVKMVSSVVSISRGKKPKISDVVTPDDNQKAA